MRPSGAIVDSEEGIGAAVSLMVCTVPAETRRPRCSEQRGRRGVTRQRAGQTCLPSGPAVGPASSEPPEVKGSGGPDWVVVLPASSPSASCASCSPMSDSFGVESPAVSIAVETVLPELLSELGTGSSR